MLPQSKKPTKVGTTNNDSDKSNSDEEHSVEEILLSDYLSRAEVHAVVDAFKPVLLRHLREGIDPSSAPRDERVYSSLKGKLWTKIDSKINQLRPQDDGSPDIVLVNWVELILMVIEPLIKTAVTAKEWQYHLATEFPEISLADLVGSMKEDGKKRAREPPLQQPPIQQQEEAGLQNNYRFLEDHKRVMRHAVQDDAGNWYFDATKYYVDLPLATKRHSKEILPDNCATIAKRKRYASTSAYIEAELQKTFASPSFPNSAIKLEYLTGTQNNDHAHPYHILATAELIFFGTCKLSKPDFVRKYMQGDADTGSHYGRMGKILKNYSVANKDCGFRCEPTSQFYSEIGNGTLVENTPKYPYLILGGYVGPGGPKYFLYHPPTARVIPSANQSFGFLGWNVRGGGTNSIIDAVMRVVWPTNSIPGCENTKDEAKVEPVPAFFIYRENDDTSSSDESI